jgi:hypothetical protein
MRLASAHLTANTTAPASGCRGSHRGPGTDLLAKPTIEARLADLGTVPMLLNAQEFAAFIAAESEKRGKVVRIANNRAAITEAFLL